MSLEFTAAICSCNSTKELGGAQSGVDECNGDFSPIMNSFGVDCLRNRQSSLCNMETNHLAAILEDLERRDIYKVWKHGVPEDLERQLESLCAEYRNGSPSSRDALTTAINHRKATNRAQWFLLSFSSHMATRAMQRKDKETLSSGIIALHLSNIANIDFRDSFGAIGQLAFSAQQCGIRLVEYASLVCPDLSPRLVEFMKNPGPVKVGPDAHGDLVFQRSDEDEARRARWNEFIKAHREKRTTSKKAES